MKIAFNKPYMTGKELWYISKAHHNNQLSGDGPFTKRCQALLEETTGATKVLLTHSCTAALEMTAILADIQPGDEVILPSFTFVSTANAFLLRGGVPVFIDIRPDTLNIDETKIEAAITPKTKAIVPVHYAGVGCEMDTILEIAKKHNLLVIEDAAQGICATYKGKALGSIGDLGTFSFHETKNIISGEGGALLINNPKFIERAEIIREKGTNRSRFFRGQVDKYTWVDIGSSYLPGEVVAAFLQAQIEEMGNINARRLAHWHKYNELFQTIADQKRISLPYIPEETQHNAHMYYILLESEKVRAKLIEFLKRKEIYAVFHYVPLHSSEAGMKYGRTHGSLENTENLSNRLLRLPMFIELTNEEIERVFLAVKEFFSL